MPTQGERNSSDPIEETPSANARAAARKRRTSGKRAFVSSEMPTRLMLQRRAPDATRRHAVRAMLRGVGLLTLDLGTFWVLRGIVRLVRDEAVYGEPLATALQSVFPQGLLGGFNFVVALVIGLSLSGAYGRGDQRRDLSRIAKGTALAVSLSLWSVFWRAPDGFVILQAILMLAIIWSGLSVARLLFDAALKLVFQTPADGDPMVFVGDRADEEARRIHDSLLGKNRMRHSRWVNLPQLGDENELSPADALTLVHDALAGENADTLVLCGEYGADMFEAIVEVATSAGIRVLAVPRISGVVQAQNAVVWYGGNPFVELTVPSLRGWQLFIKRGVDIVAAAVGLVILSPLFAVVAALIKSDSPGPVFFSQERVGYAGRVFRVFKFRTMRRDADSIKQQLAHLNASGDSRLFKIPDDPRITPLGKFLRKWSIDELPQLFNVLNGEMSLVGPRPFFEEDLKNYLDHHFARLGAKPGITGLWQVKGRSAVVDFEEVVRLDREYIEEWSVWLDLWILLQTVPAVLRGRGAY
jgi:exopolysaccharide biosynthesis polyprenyl glycosylphosphotransferase